MADPTPLALIMQGGDHRHINAMVALAATAAASGRWVHVFLTHEALWAWVEGRFDDLPSGFSTEYGALYDAAREDGRVPDLEKLMRQARATGKVRIYGCSASVALRRGYSEEALRRLDGIVGHSTFLRWALGWQLVFI